MKHFLVYNSDEAGNGYVGDPILLLSFEDEELPNSFLEENRFVHAVAAKRVGHNFVSPRATSVGELNDVVEKLEKKTEDMYDFLTEAQLAEGMF